MSYEVKVDFEERQGTLTIFHNGVALSSYTDGGEPEDNYFYRDWNWIANELKLAYEMGRMDGICQMGKMA